MNRKGEILVQLGQVVDPRTGRALTVAESVHDVVHTEDGEVSFRLELPPADDKVKERITKACEDAVRALPWVKEVMIMISTARPAPRPAALEAQARGLQGVKNILAVSSCKGGVGKSTVAVNLAYALSRLDHRVGLFDADVYGPSLPTMVSPAETQLYQVADLIQPLEYEGVKLMSFGFASNAAGGGPAIMRGPMVTQVINQLLTTTEWGELDYLVLDLPPGTGDIQLTLTQLIPITAAIIVTTPQQLSFVDVVKGIQMFDKLKVPTVAVVENMSYFECPGCAQRHYLFGQGARRRLVEQFGIRNSFEVPILPEISRLSDHGRPVVLEQPDGPGRYYRELAESVVLEVRQIREGRIAMPSLQFVGGRGLVVTLADGTEKVIQAAELRRRCRCAHCVEEFSGRPLLKPEDVPDTVYPKRMQPMGNYAVAVSWSDGHSSSIYPYEMILELAAGS